MQTTRAVQAAAWMIITVFVVLVLTYYRSILQPFVLALIFWYLVKILREGLRKIKLIKRRVPEWVYSLGAFIIITLILFGISEILIVNIEQIGDKLEGYQEIWREIIYEQQEAPWMKNLVPELKQRIAEFDYQSVLQSILASLTGIAGNAVLITIYVIFLLIEENIFTDKINHIFLDESKQNKFSSALEKINTSIRKYVYLKSLVSLLTGVLSYIVMASFGLDFPFLWAFLIFIFNFIPYVGSLVATLLPTLFALVQFGSPLMAGLIFVSVEAIQVLVGSYLEPRWMGKGLNLSPLVVILSLSFWGSLWGVLGMMLSVPITSILVIAMANFKASEQVAKFMSQDGKIES
jgi:predicted PurR-regulated permease PerM